MQNRLNIINELDKLVLYHFKKTEPFSMNDELVNTQFLPGTPDRWVLSDIASNIGDIKYPTLIVSRSDTDNIKLTREKNIPAVPGTKIIVNQIDKNKYINSEEPNINVETYSYNPPMYFTVQYRLTFFCDMLKHATDFQTQFFERINQEYILMKSNKFESVYFDTVWKFDNSGFSIEDNYNETNETKREIKIHAIINGDGYYLSQDSRVIERTVSKNILKTLLK